MADEPEWPASLPTRCDDHRARSARTGPTRPAPRLRHRRRAGPAGQDALLLLRPAVRHPAQGQGQRRSIGFEPWEEFPFNRGMLCPKGVKRYLQGAHPDRLLTAYERDPASPAGFRPLPYDEAIRRVADGDPAHPGGARQRRLRGPQRRQPDDGESVPDGQVRPRVPEDRRTSTTTAGCAWSAPRRPTRRPSASTAPPIPGPTSCRPRSSGSAAPTSPNARPITTNYVWQARENGGQDHRRRSAHHADRPHLRPVPAGQAGPRHRPVQRHPAPDDRERLARPRLHRDAHGRLREGGRARPASGRRGGPPR